MSCRPDFRLGLAKELFWYGNERRGRCQKCIRKRPYIFVTSFPPFPHKPIKNQFTHNQHTLAYKNGTTQKKRTSLKKKTCTKNPLEKNLCRKPFGKKAFVFEKKRNLKFYFKGTKESKSFTIPHRLPNIK